jgi:hypothetical protein
MDDNINQELFRILGIVKKKDVAHHTPISRDKKYYKLLSKLFSNKALLTHVGYMFIKNKRFPVDYYLINIFSDNLSLSFGIDKFIARAIVFITLNKLNKDFFLMLGCGYLSTKIKKELDDVNNPDYNLGLIYNELLLMENHLYNSAHSISPYHQHCANCLMKHSHTCLALTNELIQLDSTGKYKELLIWLKPEIEEIANNSNHLDWNHDMLQKIRSIRKRIH